MELATTQSVLMQIQPTIQRFARMLASVLQLEVEIVDENLCRVAGTGAYGKFLGRQLSGNSRLLRHVLETKTEKVVTQSRFDPLCEGCDSKENCREKAFLGTPVILQDRCVGVISLIAVTHEQQEHISDNLREFSDYVRHISTIFVSKLLEDQGPGDNISKIFATMIDNMDQGVLVVDDEKEIADLLEVYLKNDNYIVHKYYNGIEALECIQKTEIDLAILDVMLPDIDGFRICQKIPGPAAWLHRFPRLSV